MTDEHVTQLSRIGPLLRQAQRHSARTFVAALQPLGIEGRHYGVLYHVELLGPLSQRRLMDLTGEDRSSMVRTMDDLERIGLAERRPDPTDRRAHAVELTDAGRRVLVEAGAIAEGVAGSMLDIFTPHERDTLFALLERFVNASARPTADPTPQQPRDPRVEKGSRDNEQLLQEKGARR
jgi:DNA-binding MarR family transcriptional regulator